jgi:hypothetical protein
MSESTRVGEALRAAVAGGHAAKLIGSATAIFQAGGNKLLSAAAQSTLRTAVEKGAEKAIATATGAFALPAELSPRKLIGSGARATTAVVKGGARVAVREIAKGTGKAAGIGFVVDGAVATVEGVVAVRAGTMDRNEAMKHVAKEATTGAIATGAGVLLATGLVALTGGVAAPVVFAVGAVGSIGTKRVLRKWIGGSNPIIVTA